MKKIALFGSGKIGETIALLLTASGRYSVRVCDIVEARARKTVERLSNAESALLDLSDSNATTKLVRDCCAVISALPFSCNPAVARAAHEAGIHYLDLTEDVATTQYISKLAESATSAFIPQCGLAPGFISVAAQHLFSRFDSVDSLKLRVGALPVYPTNRLKYNLTWSTEGLINEYINQCEAIVENELRLVTALEGHEHFSLDGIDYEAFNTSGGLGSLASTLLGKVRSLDYKTIRYPGHRDLMLFLLEDLRFANDRDSLKQIFERSISATSQDKCVISVQATGWIDGKFTQKTYASTVYNQVVHGIHLGAIQITTAAGVCGVLDLITHGGLRDKRGFVRVEEIPLTEFLKNDFGSYYRDELALAGV